MKGKGLTIAIVLIFVAGLSLLLYPSVSNYWNSLHQAQVIVDYNKEMDQMTRDTYDRLWAQAEEWNRTTAHRAYILNEEQTAAYYDLLDLNDRDLLGYLEIPSLGINLPVGHGTGDKVLQTSVGHLEWSSLPVGGEGTHCVLSGHRGLPTSELLTNIDRLEAGDRFSLHVLGEELVYQVDQIAVVEPDDLSLLRVEEGQDYVTLVTCTPYGINSHRLLVRGVRLEQSGSDSQPTLTVHSDVDQLDLRILIPVALVLLAVVVFLLLIWGNARRARGGKRLMKRTIPKWNGGPRNET